MPCRDMYSDKGPFQLGPQEGETKQETIHWSVHGLINCGAIVDDEPPLKGAEFVHNIRPAEFSHHIPFIWDFKDK